MSHVETILAAEPDETEPIRRGHACKRRECPVCEEKSRADRYAPVRFTARCKSRTGYKRRAHEWDRDGRCIYCDKVRTWDPL